MKSCEMRIPGYDARSQRGWIRWELFLHEEVRDVLPTPREDTLCVVYRGEPDADAWTATLTVAGFPTPRFEETVGDANTDDPDSAPQAELATIEHAGPHAEIDRSYGALAAYVAEHALGVPGPIREYYLTDLADTPKQDLWSARIGWPIFQTTP